MATMTSTLNGWNWFCAEKIRRVKAQSSGTYPVLSIDCSHQSTLGRVLDRLSCDIRAQWTVDPWILVELNGLNMIDAHFVWALEKIVDAHTSFRESISDRGGLLFVVTDPFVRRQLAEEFPGSVYPSVHDALHAISPSQ